jgi:Tfp pilus assembly protein PilN
MINLLPYKEKKSIERIRSIRLVRTVVAGFIVVFVVAGALLFPTFVTINSRFSIATNQIKNLEREGAIASDIDIASLQARAQAVQAKLSIPPITEPTAYVEIVKSIAQSGITIDRFSYQETKNLEVSGVAQTREGLQSFIKNLEANEGVASVDSPVANFVKSKNSAFRINVLFK